MHKTPLPPITLLKAPRNLIHNPVLHTFQKGNFNHFLTALNIKLSYEINQQIFWRISLDAQNMQVLRHPVLVDFERVAAMLLPLTISLLQNVKINFILKSLNSTAPLYLNPNFPIYSSTHFKNLFFPKYKRITRAQIDLFLGLNQFLLKSGELSLYHNVREYPSYHYKPTGLRRNIIRPFSICNLYDEFLWRLKLPEKYAENYNPNLATGYITGFSIMYFPPKEDEAFWWLDRHMTPEEKKLLQEKITMDLETNLERNLETK